MIDIITHPAVLGAVGLAAVAVATEVKRHLKKKSQKPGASPWLLIIVRILEDVTMNDGQSD